MSYRVLLTCEYDGTDFVGFQHQENQRSVQDELSKALYAVFGEEIAVTGCSRTDSGVHARGHVSHCDVPIKIPEDRLPYAINSFLPSDLAVKKAMYVRDDFSARFDNNGKRYCYRIYKGAVRSPLISRYSYHAPYNLDISKMQKAATYFAGEHDFAAFCAVGGSQMTTVRKLNYVKVSVSPMNSDLIEIEVSGEAFLYNMVRIIAGTVFEVGIGKINPDDISDIISSCDRKRAGKTLPACGLTLEEVYLDI